MKKLNLGCGTDIKDGYINIDIIDYEGVTKVDLNKLPYPFPNNYFNEILAISSIEHLTIDLDILMKELHRIMKKNGKLIISVPHYTNPSAYLTQHKTKFGSRTFIGYINSYPQNRWFDFNFSKIDVKIKFVRGVHFYNHFIEYLANKGISKYYESTFLSAFPAKRLEIKIEK